MGKDIGVVFGNKEWTEIMSQCGKFVKECKCKLTQYKIIQRYYWTPVRLNRLGLMNNKLCWKCQNDNSTLIHCLWECPVIQRFWTVVMQCLSDWLERTVPPCPKLCLLGDKGQISDLSKDRFSVIMVGVSVAARTILKHWKDPGTPQFKEWVNLMIKTASYECVLYKVNNRDGNYSISLGIILVLCYYQSTG